MMRYMKVQSLPEAGGSSLRTAMCSPIGFSSIVSDLTQ